MILSALAAVVLWGAAAPVTKVTVVELPPLAVGALRTVLAGAAVLPLALVLRVPWPRTAAQGRLLAIAALTGFVGFPLLFSAGLARTSAVHGAMMLALLPVMTGAIAKMWDRSWPGALWWVGCAVALAGEGVLIWSGAVSGGDARSSLAGDALVIAAGLVVASGYVAGGRLKQAGYPSQGTTYWGIVAASALFIPALPWLLADVSPERVPALAWGGVVFLAFGATTLGYVCWFWALGRGDIHRVGLFQFLQPISGVVIAWAALGETLAPALALATVLVLAGVWIAVRPRRSRNGRTIGEAAAPSSDAQAR